MAVDRVERQRRRDSAADIFDLPTVRLRGRNVLALVLAPEFPMSDWFTAFDRQLNAAPGFFADRPIVADLRPALSQGGQQAIGLVLDTLALRDLKLIGVEGVEARQLAGTPWERLATRLHGRDTAVETPEADPDAPSSTEADPEAEPAAAGQTSLLIDRPVRSGQSVVFAEGDVTVVGSVSSGAEVLAGGSIHIYGALRGRAIAGLRAGASARIFCRKLEAELVGVDQLYRTAENWGAGLHGRAVQVMCDRGSLRLSAFD
ncbi:MAG TPA: septum site-determining protein MinC [Caulobacteraceae bacterium]|jgi:septum site-determining protein MinC